MQHVIPTESSNPLAPSSGTVAHQGQACACSAAGEPRPCCRGSPAARSAPGTPPSATGRTRSSCSFPFRQPLSIYNEKGAISKDYPFSSFFDVIIRRLFPAPPILSLPIFALFPTLPDFPYLDTPSHYPSYHN